MEIKTSRLLLREFRPDDASAIHDIAVQDGFVFYNLDRNRETAHAFVDRAIGLQAPCDRRTSFKLAVTPLHKPKACTGYVGFDDLDGPQPDIGYLMHPKEQGMGYATEAMKELMLYVLAVQGRVDQIWLTVHPDNVASRHVARKLTFEEVGAKMIQTVHGEEPRLVFKTNRQRLCHI